MTEKSAVELAIAVHPAVLEKQVYGDGLHTVRADVVYPPMPYRGSGDGGQTVMV